MTIRDHPQTVKRYMSIATRASVYTARVNGTPTKDDETNGIYAITYDGGSGTLADVIPGMTIEIGTTAGAADVAVLRVRATPTGTVFYVNEVSEAEAPIANDHYITVRNEFRLWQKLPRLRKAQEALSLTVYKDYNIEYTDENENIEPNIILANYKPADWVDAGDTVRTVALDASASHEMATAATSTLTYQWYVPTGVAITVGTDTDDTITVEADPGFYLLRLEVTDSLSTVATRIVPIWAHDASYPPVTEFVVDSDERSVGRSMNITFHSGSVSLTDAPPGVMMCYWEDVTFGDGAVPSDYIDAMIGWVIGDTKSVRLYRSTYQITFGGPAAVLDQFNGYEETLFSKASPSIWYELQDMDKHRILHYWLRTETTFLTLFNLHLEADEHPIETLDINGGSILSQLISIAKDDTFAGLGFTSLGHCYTRQPVAYLGTYADISDRDARVAIEMTNADYVWEDGLTHVEAYYPSIAQIDQYGFAFDGTQTTILRTKAPGRTPSSGASFEVPKAISLPTSGSQTYLDRICGMDYAYRTKRVDIQNLVMVHNMDIFEPCLQQSVRITDASDNLRGLNLDGTDFVIESVSVRHSNEIGEAPKVISLNLRYATKGKAAEEDEPEIANFDWNPDINPDLTPIQIDIPDLFLPYPVIDNPYLFLDQPNTPTRIYAVGSNADSDDDEVYIGDLDWSTGLVSWTTIGTGITGSYCWSRGDPYNAKRKFITTSTGLWKIDNVDTPTTPVQVATIEEIFGSGATTWPAFFEMSINRRGWMIIMAGGSSVFPTSGAFTTDYGETWTTFDIAGGTPDFSAAGGMHVHDVKVSPYNNPNAVGQGWLYSLYYSAANTVSVMRSTDWGTTWVELFIISVPAPLSNRDDQRIFIPYTRAGGVANKNDANQLLHFVIGNTSTWGTFTAGGTLVENATASTCIPMATAELLPLNTLTPNGSYAYMVTHRSTSGVGVMRSTDAGANFLLGDLCPDAGTYRVGSEANGSPFCTGLNGWGTEGTLIHFCVGVGTGNALTAAYLNTGNAGAGSVVTAYTALGALPVQGFLRVKRAVDSDWIYIATPAFKHKIVYAEFMLVP